MTTKQAERLRKLHRRAVEAAQETGFVRPGLVAKRVRTWIKREKEFATALDKMQTP